MIEPDDHRVVWYRLASQLIVQKDGKDADLSAFALGDYLSVDSNSVVSDSDDNGIMTAVSVTWKKAGTPDDIAEASKTLGSAADGNRCAWHRDVVAQSRTQTPRLPRRPAEDGDERPILRRKDPEPAPAPAPQADTVPERRRKLRQPLLLPRRLLLEEEEPDNSTPPTQIRPPDPKPDADDPGKPVLTSRRAGSETTDNSRTRGDSLSHANSGSASAVASARVAPAPVAPALAAPAPSAPVVSQSIPLGDDPVITKTREAAFAYTETLPNYLVQQMTTRYQSDSPKAGWQALDIVSADLTYQDGHESYKNIKVGNKSVNTSMEEIPGRAPRVSFPRCSNNCSKAEQPSSTQAGRTRSVTARPMYTVFEITRDLSRWRVEAPSQLYYPAIKGSVWIDKETSRVLRIEQSGKGMPPLFPFDTIETTVDYDFIRLGTSGPYLLPVESEVLSCQRRHQHLLAQ